MLVNVGRFVGLGFILILLLGLQVAVPVRSSSILYVSTTGSDANTCLVQSKPCRTIQNAVTVASPGSTVRIYPGTYVEHVEVSTSLKLLSIAGGVTIQAPSAFNEVVLVTGVGVSLNLDAGFTIDAHALALEGIKVLLGAAVTSTGNRIIGFSDAGIDAALSSPVVASLTVTGNVIDGGGVAPYGIFVGETSGSVTITGSTIKSVTNTGIFVDVGGGFTASGNTITLSGSGDGMYIDDVTGSAKITGESITTGGSGDGIQALTVGGGFTASGNIINLGGSGDGIFLEDLTSSVMITSESITVPGTSFGIAVLTLVGGFTASGNTIKAGVLSVGIFLDIITGSVTITSESITAADSSTGITAESVVGGVTASGNTINVAGGSTGINLDVVSGSATVSSNKITMTGTGSDGIILESIGLSVTLTSDSINGGGSAFEGVILNGAGSVSATSDTITGDTSTDMFVESVGGNVAIQSSTFNGAGTAAFGVFLSGISGSISVHQSNFLSHTTDGLFIVNVKLVDATLNWWGSASGPDDDVHPPTDGCGISTTNPTGTGDSVSICVSYKPWKT